MTEAATILVRRMHGDGLTPTQIAKATGLSRPEVIFALGNSGVSKKTINRPTQLTAWAEAVLLGTMLGDGHLRRKRPSSAPHLHLSHGFAQRDYLAWKMTQLEELFLAAAPVEHKDKDGHHSVHASSRVLPLLEPYAQLFYPAGKKQITTTLLERIANHDFADAILAVWFGDDGYRSSGNGRSLGFCFGNLDEDAYAGLVKWFANQGYEGTLHIHRGRASYRYFLLRVEAAHRFRDAISPYLPDCMHYKLDIGPPRKIRRSRSSRPAAEVSGGREV